MSDGFERMERLLPRETAPRPTERRGESRLYAGLPALKPLDVGRLLDRAVDVLQRCFLPCVATAFLVRFPVQVLRLEHLGGAEQEPSLFGLNLLLELPVLLIVSAAVARIAYAALQGRRLSLGEWGRDVLLALPKLAVVVVLSSLFVGLLVAPALLLGALGGPIGTLMALLFVFPVALYAIWRLVLAQVAVVLERTGPLRSLGRSWRLTERGFWRWMGAWFLSLWLTSPLQAAAGTFADGTAQAWLRDALPALGDAGVAGLGWVLSTALLALPAAFGAILTMVIYVDQRVRREGFDLAMRLERMRREPPSEPSERSVVSGGGLA